MNTPPIADWLAEWADLWRTGNLEEHVHVAPCSRLRRSLGRCRPSTGRVTIHPALFEPAHAELLREVVCHETAHAAVYLLHGHRVRPHGREWKTLVAGAGYPPTTRMDPRRLPRDLRVRLAPARARRRSAAGIRRFLAVKRILTLAVVLLIALPATAQTNEKKRLNRALDWPTVDLSTYDRLFVEDCVITDPEAPERKIQSLVETVPGRLADYIGYGIDRGVFEQVDRRSPKKKESGLVVRVELTKYKPGSQTSRALLIGTSAARLHLKLHLLDAATGEAVHTFSEERDFNWGGHHGAKSITLMEERAAAEIAAWLMLSRGLTPDEVLERLRMPYEGDGPPEGPHGTIVIMRPQGAVGAAQRFRVGVDDVTAGESRRKTYHEIYVTPGEHEVWFGGDKWRKEKPVTIEAGGTYYFMAMGLKPLPEAKAVKKLEQCRLVRRIDLTGGG